MAQYRKRETPTKIKFMHQMPPETYKTLKKEAKKRHIPIQQLIRAVIVPDWLAHEKSIQEKK